MSGSVTDSMAGGMVGTSALLVDGFTATAVVAGLAAVGVSTAAATTVARRERSYHPRAHASRVDACRNPLGRALRYGCAGLSVGVQVGPRGRIQVVDTGEPLSRLVLDPLHARVRDRGRVYGGDARYQPFTLVLEAADGVATTHVVDVLNDELAGYTDMLSRCVAGTLQPGPVLVALSGTPRAILDARHNRLYFGEGTLSDVDRRVPTSSMPLVGEHVAWRFGWDGRDEMPPEERHVLTALIRQAHAEGKRVRIFGVPEGRRTVRHAFWRELHDAGTDLVGARGVGALRRFLRGRPAHR
ncbi:hypothetical protein [Virgisporangium ochraceum]|uniref:Uncharacterized protein n=1 Tax=Virgisporangium ochraceum TaxID=65505 RepID=A0A8J4A6Y8_9ACTN|nr:hypothetical protein [Virgisporangium ochraceum]GIJ74480.1 hypothetical protein Voc01_093970 [Virgisporangium ochraceum]